MEKKLDAVKKLAEEDWVAEDVTKLWLMKQAIWKVYLPVSKNILRTKFDVSSRIQLLPATSRGRDGQSVERKRK